MAFNPEEMGLKIHASAQFVSKDTATEDKPQGPHWEEKFNSIRHITDLDKTSLRTTGRPHEWFVDFGGNSITFNDSTRWIGPKGYDPMEAADLAWKDYIHSTPENPVIINKDDPEKRRAFYWHGWYFRELEG